MKAEVQHRVRVTRAMWRTILGRRPPRRFVRRLPVQEHPKAIQVAYFGDMMKLVELAQRLVSQLVVPVARHEAQIHQRADAPKDVNEAMRRARRQFDDSVSLGRLGEIAEGTARRTSEFQRQQLNKVLKAAVGVAVPIMEPPLEPKVRAFTADNVGLISSVPERYFTQVEQTLTRSIADGLRWEEIADELADRFDVAEGNAQRIARDQVGKFYGRLNEARQTELGIEKFTWRTMDDNRVRPEHFILDGNSYAWESPPAEGVPGEPINCRCYADPDLSAILGDL